MVKKNNSDKLLFTIAIVVIFIALVNLGITFYKFGGIDKLTGKATDTGTANLTVLSQATITFTIDNINWETGAVDEASGFAILDSEGTNVNSNFTTVDHGLVLRNDGNCNVRVNFTTSNDADGFMGGSSPVYQIKITENKSSSCTEGLASSYATATGSEQPGCSNFTYYDPQDTLRIDVNITVPIDAPKGPKGSTIIASAIVID